MVCKSVHIPGVLRCAIFYLHYAPYHIVICNDIHINQSAIDFAKSLVSLVCSTIGNLTNHHDIYHKEIEVQNFEGFVGRMMSQFHLEQLQNPTITSDFQVKTFPYCLIR